jgi:DNA topoisomerase-3
MILYIAEKASVGRALAGVLPGEKAKDENGFIKCGGDVVAWASGHLLESYDPEDYDAGLKKWSFDALPIFPEKWKRKEKQSSKKLLAGLKKLLKEADAVVNAGDADREGQFLIDEILEYCGWKGVTKRLRLNDMNPGAIREALKNMKNNADFIGEYLAGQGRDIADWLAGINLTRYCTLSAREAGFDVLFSVGRVQTPTLGLVVNRDKEIENFIPKLYYAVSATLRLPDNRQITGRWQPKTGQEGLDGEGRLIDKNVREALLDKTADSGEITSVEKKAHKKAAPLPYSLPKLQMDMSRKYDITDTLKHVQELYESGYVTYPRTDCQYLPEGHHAEAPLILDAISAACPGVMRDVARSIRSERKSPAWNDKKISEHHAIIPTAKVPLENALSDEERKAYDLIALRYAIQFLTEHEYEQTIVTFAAGTETFRATGRTVIVEGWKLWEKDDGDTEKEKNKGGGEEDETAKMPSVETGESGSVTTTAEEKKTTPPKRFTYDTLLAAMNGIHAYVTDPEIKKRLREMDGIGTAATQESIIAKLLDAKRGYLKKQNKQIISTPIGRALIGLLSFGKGAILVKPDLTALWEQKLTAVEKREMELSAFVAEVSSMLRECIGEKLLEVPDLPEIPKVAKAEMTEKKCLSCGEFMNLVPRKDGTGKFFSCPACKSTFSVGGDGEALPKAEAIETECPQCGGKARQHKGQYGLFWKCKDCGGTFSDVNGKPVVKEKAPEAKCPVKKCKGAARKYKSKSGESWYWWCPVCKNYFDDTDGKPDIREKRK